MLSPATLHEILSGNRRDWSARLVRGFLGLLEPLAAWYVARRNRDFDQGRTPITRVAAPVISVGNLTTGGTGKTPLVEWLARWLQRHGRSPVLLSRGYGSRGGRVNDEALELECKLPGVPHFQNANRVVAAQQALAQFPAAVLLLDDAFQHRWLHRDLDIVLLDALAPFGYGHLLPRGLLREPVAALRRAQAILLTRANLLDAAARSAIHEQVRQLAPRAAWAETQHEPLRLINARGEQQSLEQLKGAAVAAFCGIGNPEGFRRTLEHCGVSIRDWRTFPDHHAYTPAQLESLARNFSTDQVDFIVCTQKDLVKIPAVELGGIPLWALQVGLRFSSGETEFEACLHNVLNAASAG